MNRRIIKCNVSDEYVRGEGVFAGAMGSHDDVCLELEFSNMWAGLAKSIVWTDAQGQNPTVTMLTANMLKDGTLDTYIVPIPAAAKAAQGIMHMSIKGAQIEAEVETAAVVSVTASFVIKHSVWDENAAAAMVIEASAAEQLQSEIEAVLDDIVTAKAFGEHLPIILPNGNWAMWDITESAYVDTGSTSRGADGEDGKDGKDGTSISVKQSAEACVVIGDGYIDDDGYLQILTSLSPRTFTNAGLIRGPQGTNGEDGVSPTVSITNITNGHRVTITDKTHPSGQTFTVTDGVNGTNGYTPVRGTDYWTAADQAYIIAQVMSNFDDVSEVGA